MGITVLHVLVCYLGVHSNEAKDVESLRRSGSADVFERDMGRRVDFRPQDEALVPGIGRHHRRDGLAAHAPGGTDEFDVALGGAAYALEFTGSAGQSFGVWATKGMHLRHHIHQVGV